MAAIEHCLYAFEALAANLEKRKAMSLEGVQKSFAEYARSAPDAGETEDAAASPKKLLAKRLPALDRLAGGGSASDGSSASSSSSSSTTSLPQAQDAAAAATPMTSVSSLAPPEESPLFITWNILTPRHGYTLRGCVGTFEALPLAEGLSSYALTSALHDTRFTPVAARELPALAVAVTLLTDFEEAADTMDWTLGTHGLRISFLHHGRRYGATYLPDVATEQGWDKEETLVSLMRKAGWMGRKDSWRDVTLKVVRYQGRKETLEYAEYKRWRDWADKRKSKE